MSDTERLFPDNAGLDRAAELLRSGELVAFPTETVYGLGGNATDDRAVGGIFAAKGRPSFNPLIVHVPDIDAALAIAEFDVGAERLADAFWPGALTLVLPLRAEAGIAPLVTAGLPTIALRVPDHPVARALLQRAGCPVAAPSANPSGRISPTTADHVLAGLGGRIAAVLDGGACPVGVESTIVGTYPQPTLLRPGGLPAEAIEACLGAPLAAHGGGISAPGQMASHYAPDSPIRLNVTDARPGERLLGFGPMESDLNLSPSGDLTEAAANLFRHLHALDATAAPIAVAPIPEHGLGRAINDRLRRAAAPRD
ncbi:L-threonylcarbamoyladenylate synthase [Pseudoruegeria sp. HB172150]|uniref:L-threonylcarbamoyladenylate synthase n=1 Tax=Pseudoruegeria sp. HB172150 TaxID=2721164 RepID=UPI0015532010|nr:L-threonylcarbamoyladenylate synthase [Pseudoruegeria sp. HB172150]